MHRAEIQYIVKVLMILMVLGLQDITDTTVDSPLRMIQYGLD